MSDQIIQTSECTGICITQDNMHLLKPFIEECFDDILAKRALQDRVAKVTPPDRKKTDFCEEENGTREHAGTLVYSLSGVEFALPVSYGISFREQEDVEVVLLVRSLVAQYEVSKHKTHILSQNVVHLDGLTQQTRGNIHRARKLLTDAGWKVGGICAVTIQPAGFTSMSFRIIEPKMVRIYEEKVGSLYR